MELLERIKETNNENRTLRKETIEVREMWGQYLKNNIPDPFIMQALSEGIPARYFRQAKSKTRRDFDNSKALATLHLLNKSDQRIRVLTDELSELLREAWQTEMPLNDIAKALDTSSNSTYVKLRRYDWFDIRYQGRQSKVS